MPDTSPPPNPDSVIIANGKEYTKHQKHWCTYGDVIIGVDTTAFKVLKSAVAGLSPVLAALPAFQSEFPSLSESGGGGRKRHPGAKKEKPLIVDGLPFTTISPSISSSKTFALLLDDIFRVPGIRPATTPLEIVDMLRLTNALEIRSLYGTAQIRAQFVLPSRLVNLDLLATYIDTPLVAVRVALDFGGYVQKGQAPGGWYVPLAMYALATMEWRSADEAQEVFEQGGFGARDFARMVVGRKEMVKFVVERALGGGDGGRKSTSPPAGSPTSATPTCECYTTSHKDTVSRWNDLLAHPLETLLHWSLRGGRCDICRPVIRKASDALLVEFFEALPKMFDIPKSALEPPPVPDNTPKSRFTFKPRDTSTPTRDQLKAKQESFTRAVRQLGEHQRSGTLRELHKILYPSYVAPAI